MCCYFGYPRGNPIEFINETETTVFAYRVESGVAQHFMTIEPQKSDRYTAPIGGHTFVFSSSAKEPLIFCKESAEEYSPNHYCLEISENDRERDRSLFYKSLVSVRIFVSPERTLKRLCLETVADRVLKSKCGIERLPVPKALKDRYAMKPAAKVDELCLPRRLKDDLRQLVEDPTDYPRAKHLIQHAAHIMHSM